MPYPVPLLDTPILREPVITEVVTRGTDLAESPPQNFQLPNSSDSSSYDPLLTSPVGRSNITIPEFISQPLEFSRGGEFSTKATDLGDNLQGKVPIREELEVSSTNLPEFEAPASYNAFAVNADVAQG
jgi:hypothetical protein